MCLERAAQAARPDPLGLASLGDLFKRLGRVDDARDAYQRAIEIVDKSGSDDADVQVSARLGIARLALAAGDAEAARQEVLRALASDPARPDILTLLGRVYASVQQWDDEQVAEYFRTLEPHMQAPLDAKSPWLAELGGEIFSEGALAPKARRQDLKALTDAIVRWALEPPPWLAAELTETSA